MLRNRSFSKKNQGFTGISHHEKPQQSTQAGNALWFILIAIGLLGLLTAMLSRSSSTSNDTGSFEQTQIAANEILNYAKSIETAVTSLRSRGCSENEISFQNAVLGAGSYVNPNAPADNSCHVFEPQGTGLVYELPEESWLDGTYDTEPWYGAWQFTARNIVRNAYNYCGSAECADLIMVLTFVNRELCLQLNNLIGIDNPGGEPPPETSGVGFNFIGLEFNGTYGFSSGIDNSTSEQFASGCIDPVNLFGTAFTDTYHYYHVLHAR